jgi:hypothetical protein
MNKLNRFTSQLSRSAVALALLSVGTTLAAGCATNPPRVEEAVAADHPDDWAERMSSLPVQVHGAVPGETSAQTIAAIDHGTANQASAEFGSNGLSLDALPRVVVYIGGTTAPARDQYCSLDPDTIRSVAAPTNALILRSELCDGPRAVAYARITLPEANPTAETVARGIDRLKGSLVRSLPPLEPMLQANYWN